MTHAPLDPLPRRFAALPTDPRGYPVPWFVHRLENGTYDFRVMDGEKFRRAVKDRLCWVCGQPLGKWLAFGIGPMCSITRTIAEPPSHLECMTWSIRNCPFIVNPKFTRDQANLPAGAVEPAGLGLKRNPGVLCLWVTRSYETFTVPNQLRDQPPLVTVGEPEVVTWWREGRPATRAEVEDSIATGLPALLAAAQAQGPFAVESLGSAYHRARVYLPTETAVQP